MDAALFDYELPEDRIANRPAMRRDESKLLVVERQSGRVSHHIFRELPDLLPVRTALFRNNARVMPARLPGRRPNGSPVECLLLRPAKSGDAEWWCLLRPGKKAAASGFHWGDVYQAAVVAQDAGEYRVRFALPAGKTLLGVAEEIGALPLPPYIEKTRRDDVDYAALDRERYQTVYADPAQTVAAAAPTAGLHFTPEVLAALAAHNIAAHDLTLHVGLGTFQPIKEAAIENHAIHRELYEIPPKTLAALAAAKATGLRRLAVGTTALRALEDFARKHAASGSTPDAATSFLDEASLFIYPPADFAGADALLTNFHLPRSTLICLVSAFLTPMKTDGIAWLRELYREAIAKDYRFYSYGDAMLVL